MTVFVETERLVLRRFDEADLPTFLAYRNDAEVARFQSWRATSEGEARRFIAEMGAAHPGVAGPGFQFAVAVKGSGHVGDCYLKLLDYDVRQAEIGYTLARGAWGRGYATEAVRGMLGFVFDSLRLHRVSAYTAVRNARSVALLERVGMRREGRLRQSFWFADGWQDEYLYALLAAEWGAAKEPPAIPS
jgi:RimJ/RimL family protein N-acetyltransferase